MVELDACVARFCKSDFRFLKKPYRPTRPSRESPAENQKKINLYSYYQPVIIFCPSKLYIKLTKDILPRAPWNSCEEILGIERVPSILLRQTYIEKHQSERALT